MKHRNKRGVAVEYAIIVMLVVIAFTLTILITSRAALTQASEYNDYIEQKCRIDEIGSVCTAYYVDGTGTASDITAVAEGYDFSITLFDKDTAAAYSGAVGTVEVKKSSKVYLTLKYTSDGNSLELTAYVYGEL